MQQPTEKRGTSNQKVQTCKKQIWDTENKKASVSARSCPRMPTVYLLCLPGSARGAPRTYSLIFLYRNSCT